MNLIKFIKNYQADIVLAIAVVLISIISFNLGKISSNQQKKTPITISETGSTDDSKAGGTGLDKISSSHRDLAATQVVASKNSTGKLYHFPWCSGASKIADKNKLTFANEAAAISAGYTLAGNCQK